MKVTILAAVSDDYVIGSGGQLPWHIPGDLARFRALTAADPLVMGRRTWDSLPRKPLPGRPHIVLSRRENAPWPQGVVQARSFAEALALCGPCTAVSIIGGGAVYREALDVAQVLELTWVHSRIQGDTFFPAFGHLFREVSRSPRVEGLWPHTYARYERRT